MPDGDQPAWLGRDAWFRTVDSYAAVTDLLGDARMHANLVDTLEGLGLGSGPAREHMAVGFLSTNGSTHKAHRNVVAPWFTPRAVEAVRPTASAAAERLTDELVSATTCDFVTAFAVPYITEVTATFLGIPHEDPSGYIGFVRLINSRDEDFARRVDEFERGFEGLATLSRRLLFEESGAEDGVVAKLARAVAQHELPEMVAVMFLVGVFTAGNDPAINQLGLAIEVLSERPAMWDQLGSGSLDVAAVVEELLRYRPTNQQISRRVDESFSYESVDFREGEAIVLRLAAANHDPCRFAAPDDFAPEVNTGAHVAFGFGAHYCIGAALARLQLQQALSTLAARATCPTIVELVSKPEGGIAGADRLVVSMRPRSAARSD